MEESKCEVKIKILMWVDFSLGFISHIHSHFPGLSNVNYQSKYQEKKDLQKKQPIYLNMWIYVHKSDK